MGRQRHRLGESQVGREEVGGNIDPREMIALDRMRLTGLLAHDAGWSSGSSSGS